MLLRLRPAEGCVVQHQGLILHNSENDLRALHHLGEVGVGGRRLPRNACALFEGWPPYILQTIHCGRWSVIAW